MPELPPEYLDPNTPPDVVVTDRVRPPIEDPTLGEPLGPPAPDLPSVPDSPARRLVTIGDSLTHGMISGAVFRTDLSWPALVAENLGAGPFTHPTYAGPLDGLPLNLETVLRQLQDRYGEDLNLAERIGLPVTLQRLVDANEDYWERGDGHRPPPTDVRYDNLGIYGWDVRDALSYSAARATARANLPTHDDLLGAKPENDNDIAAASVLAPFGPDAAQLDAAARHGADGGIGALVIMLGANNALGSVIDKNPRWSGPGFDDLDSKEAFNVWRPSHFAQEYANLVAALRPIAARTVLLATVPHVTIAPIAKGINPDNPGQKWREGSRYFPYYVDPWIDERSFRPSKHRHLTHQQARAIDSAIDQFNDTITEAVRQARREGRDWQVLDLCGVLDGLSYRRFADDPAAAARNDWRRFGIPPALADLDTRFFSSDKTGRHAGGLFGLDGVHPTTCGYGIVAQAVLDILAPGTTIDFAALRTRDTLNTHPPPLLASIFELLAPFLTWFVSPPPQPPPA
ncbi:hypothetical protein [Pseudonocardia acaciae]|uniref:hypothetical protein n=1 Tax=Pseudonocardia acaciae TaxID=551276 RepID=UPI000685B33E|nr:hypothetical protein [Pseudonocardia acaciae]